MNSHLFIFTEVNLLGLDTQMMNFLFLLYDNLGFIVRKFFGHILSVLLFGVFIYWNQGIALGLF